MTFTTIIEVAILGFVAWIAWGQETNSNNSQTDDNPTAESPR